MPNERLPDIDPTTGLRRFDCPKCNKLVFRFTSELKGGPMEIPCRPSCRGSDGKRTIHSIFFNEAGPSW